MKVTHILALVLITITSHVSYSQQGAVETQRSNKAKSPDLVAYWPLNGNAHDKSQNKFDGIIYGAKPTTDRFDRPNKALEFDGQTDYIEFPSSSLNDLPTGTVSAWFFLNDINKLQVILDKTETGTVNDFQLVIHYNPWIDNKMMLRIDDRYGEVPGSLILSNVSISPEQWWHVAVTWDGAVWKMYLNGDLETSAPMTRFVLDTSRRVLVGKVENNTAFLDGKIDEIRIYNRALSQAEIKELVEE